MAPVNGNRLSRRLFLTALGLARFVSAAGSPLSKRTSVRPVLATEKARPWWQRFLPFTQGGDVSQYQQLSARMVIFGGADDPTWGPLAQRLSELDSCTQTAALQRAGARIITWIEGFGDCMVYVAEIEPSPTGGFIHRADDPRIPRLERSHWSWSSTPSRPGVICWIGIQNAVNGEPFCPPEFTLAGKRISPPRYPDGTLATGEIADYPYPLSARVFDACGAKDINGTIRPAFDPTPGVNDPNPHTETIRGPTAGLYPAVVGKDDISDTLGRKAGESVYCGIISVHKDLSAPFWREYARSSAREIARAGFAGVWCDNYSPWDNFGYPPLQKAFGDWSVHNFRHSWQDRRREKPRRAMDIRAVLKQKAVEFGAKSPENQDDPAWKDPRWLDDPLWRAYKAYRQRSARHDLRAFYEAVHAGAREGGARDFLISGNDIPFFGLGWTRDGWLDMVNTELTAGWHPGTGSRGIMIPPVGKMAPVYAAAQEHQKGPFVNAWYYLNGSYSSHQKKPGIATVLLAEAFAHGAFLLHDSANPAVMGDEAIHARWNRFVLGNEDWFGDRRPQSDLAILFSPDNQLHFMTPGGFVDMDRQPHIFGYYGWATACVDGHRSFRAITDWKLTPEHLSAIRVLVLPHAECMEEAALDAIVRWTRNGGKLLITGPAGTRFGPEGDFVPRRGDLVSRLGTSGPENQWNQVGRGALFHMSCNQGMDYYLRAEERQKLRPTLMRSLPTATLLSTDGLPTTLGVTTWRATDQNSIYLDFVNYNLREDDSIAPARNVRCQLRIPDDWEHVGVSWRGFSPSQDPLTTIAGRILDITLPAVRDYLSLRVTPS